jgi:hypothetical protein
VVTIANYEKFQEVKPVDKPVDNSEDDKQNDKQDDNQTTNKTTESDKQNDKPTLYTNNYKESLSKNDNNNARTREGWDDEKARSKAMEDVMMFRRMCEIDPN